MIMLRRTLIMSPPPQMRIGLLVPHCSPLELQGKLSTANVIKMVPGPTRYAVSHIQDIKSAFELFITPSVENNILEMINLEGCMADFYVTDLQTYIGCSFWQACTSQKEKQQQAFEMLTLEGQYFQPPCLYRHVFSFVIRFDDKEIWQGQREYDKLAAIRDVWDKYIQWLHFLYNPGPTSLWMNVWVHFMTAVPSTANIECLFGIKIWAACDAQSSYACNMQVYTGKSPGQAPEKNQDTRVVLDMAEGLHGHDITCDLFFTSYM